MTYGSHKFLSSRIYLERLLEKETLLHLRLAPLKYLLRRKELRDKTSLLLGCKGSPLEKRLTLDHFYGDYTLNERSNHSFRSLYSHFALGLQESEDPLFSKIKAIYLFLVDKEKEVKGILRDSGEENDVLESILCINRVYFP